MKKALIACTVISIALVSFDCTSVHRRFMVESYKKNPGQMIKRIVIISKPSPQNKDLSGLISTMTRDLIRTNRNYLVYGIVSTEREVAEACKTRDGVLEMSLERADAAGEHIDLEITGELRRCSDDSVVWSATASASGKSQNRSLKNLVQNYVEEHGNQAEVYAAPAFKIIVDIIEAMPNPELTEDELMEKIDLEISMAPGKDLLSMIGSRIIVPSDPPDKSILQANWNSAIGKKHPRSFQIPCCLTPTEPRGRIAKLISEREPPARPRSLARSTQKT